MRNIRDKSKNKKQKKINEKSKQEDSYMLLGAHDGRHEPWLHQRLLAWKNFG